MSFDPSPRPTEAWPQADHDRARLLVALGGASWLPLVWEWLWSGRADHLLLSLLPIAVTLLPLAMLGRKAFRCTCWSIAGLMVGLVLLTGPYAIYLLPLGAVMCPAAILLLIAAKPNVGRTAAVVGTVLAAAPLMVIILVRAQLGG